jgi:hypothetical protein
MAIRMGQARTPLPRTFVILFPDGVSLWQSDFMYASPTEKLGMMTGLKEIGFTGMFSFT